MAKPARVNLEDLIDSDGVARELGLANRRVVSVYQARYPDMPRPVLVSDGGRCKLWLRPEIEDWSRRRRPQS